MTIQTRLTVTAVLTLLVLIIVSFISYSTTESVRIKGDAYNHIVNSKDLIADVLPPPEYIIEARLASLEIVEDPKAFDAFLKRLDVLEKDFHDRQVYWEKSDLDPKLKSMITGEAKTTAEVYFSLLREELIPLVKAGRIDEARVLVHGKLEKSVSESLQYNLPYCK